ncbi:hypothetical protein [Thalassobacillus devorans]|uniref:hypothetical protein n=1 Tax=Thalassobacillus devorans TaxID=279813 RepID=UPI0004B324E5|nr:hypothetical protein [Thalassobacillus devorans]
MIHEIIPHKWGKEEIVTSPIYGKVEEIRVKEGEMIIEGQHLLAIINDKGTLEYLATGVSSLIDSLNVASGDEVIRGDVLLFLKG